MPYKSVGALGECGCKEMLTFLEWRVLEGDTLERQFLEWGTY